MVCSASAARPDAPDAGLLEGLHGAGEIGDGDQRHQLERAGGGLGEDAGLGGGVALGADHGAGAEGGGRAQDGPDIVGIGDLVEHQQGGLLGVGQAVAHLIYVDRGEGLGQQGEALMHGARRQQAVERLAIDRLQARRALRPRLRQLEQDGVVGGGLGRVEQPVRAAARIAERGLDRMDAEQPVGRADGGRLGSCRVRRGGPSEAACLCPYRSL